MESYDDELTLRDLVEILRRKRLWILGSTVFALALAGIYAFLIAKPVYQASAILSVSPLKVKAQLENKIQLQQRGLLTFEGLRALALSQEAMARVLQEIRAQNELGKFLQSKKLKKDETLPWLQSHLHIKDKTAKPRSNIAEPPTLIGLLSVRIDDPYRAAEIANIWAKVTAALVNDLPARQLEANLQALGEQITPAETAYRKAQTDWETFQRTTNLAEWNKELSQRIEEKVTLQRKVETLRRTIREKEARLADLEEKMQQERLTFSGPPTPQQLAFIERDLKEAKAYIKNQYLAALKDYQQAQEALTSFKNQTPIERWKNELHNYLARIAEIDLRLKTITTERAKLTEQLATVQAQLNRTPERITLKREITADPVTALAASQDLAALRGLKLENETLYSVHTDLVKKQNALNVSLNALQKEAQALSKEREKLLPLTNDLRQNINNAAAKIERLNVQTTIARARYEGWAKLYKSYKDIHAELHFESPNPRYQKMRSEKLALEIDVNELKTRQAGLESQIQYDTQRIRQLKEKVAAAELEADRLEETLRLTKETYLALKQKQTDLKIELASVKNSLAQVLAPAYPIPEPVAPKKKLILVLALFLGLMFGVFAAFISAALEPPPEELGQKA